MLLSRNATPFADAELAKELCNTLAPLIAIAVGEKNK
jgi:hypothetical protein